MAVRMLCAATLAAGAAAAFPGTYKLDATWPADLAKIGVRHPTHPTPRRPPTHQCARSRLMNGTSGIDVDPVAGEVYMCQQRGSPRVSVWDEKSAPLRPHHHPASRADSHCRLVPRPT